MTREEAQRWLHMFTAFACGRTLQARTSHGNWEDTSEVNLNREPWRYRIRPEPRDPQEPVFLINQPTTMSIPTDPPPADVFPKPFRVPLTLKDVPPGSALRRKGGDYWALITYASEDRVVWDSSTGTYQFLMELEFQILRPGYDWEPAYTISYAE